MEFAVRGFRERGQGNGSGVKILYAVIGPAAYDDKAGGKRVTDQLIGAGADVIFGQGDGASFGMVQAVETASLQRGSSM